MALATSEKERPSIKRPSDWLENELPHRRQGDKRRVTASIESFIAGGENSKFRRCQGEERKQSLDTMKPLHAASLTSNGSLFRTLPHEIQLPCRIPCRLHVTAAGVPARTGGRVAVVGRIHSAGSNQRTRTSRTTARAAGAARSQNPAAAQTRGDSEAGGTGED